MHACASCLCEHVCTCVQACTQRSEGGIRSPLSLSIPLRQGLSLNLGLNFSWLGWKLASPSDSPVFVSQSWDCSSWMPGLLCEYWDLSQVLTME